MGILNVENMTVVFHSREYRELGKAVNKGMSIAVAKKTLSKQREIGGRGEQYFWRALEEWGWSL